MPRQRHERRYAVVTCGTGVKPPKPGVSRYDYPDITSPLPPCEAMRSVSDENVTVRDWSGSGKSLPAAGAYLRVSGPSGPLTGVYEGRTAFFPASFFLRS